MQTAAGILGPKLRQSGNLAFCNNLLVTIRNKIWSVKEFRMRHKNWRFLFLPEILNNMNLSLARQTAPFAGGKRLLPDRMLAVFEADKEDA